jgi:hypothetical protein
MRQLVAAKLLALASFLESDTEPFNMSRHTRCALGAATRLWPELDGDFASSAVADYIGVEPEDAQQMFIFGRKADSEAWFDLEEVTREQMVRSLRHWAETGIVGLVD